MTDGMRRQSVGAAGVDPVFTPHLDAFAREGVLCDNAVTNSPLCTPARACFLTGKHPGSITGNPPRVNMLFNWQRLPVEEMTFAKSATAQGYDTALIGKWHLDDYEPGDAVGDMWNAYTPPGPRRMGFRFWYSYGCIHNHWTLRYMDTEGRYLDLGEGYQVDHETDVAAAYLRNRNGERPADRPFLLWLNWGPPHNIGSKNPFHRPNGPSPQYAAPPEDELIYRRATHLPVAHPAADRIRYREEAPGYFGCITHLDRAFGRLLHVLEEESLADNTLVVFTSDHGEMLGIHGRWLKDIWYEESIGIPLLLRYPGKLPCGRREQGLIGLVDLFPTLFGLAGLAVPEGRHGRDYSQQLCGLMPADAAEPESQLLAFNTGAPPPELTPYQFPDESGRYWRGLRTATHLYVVLDQRPTNHRWFYDADRLRDALPPGTDRLAYDLVNDPHERSPILPGHGQDALLDLLHAELKSRLEAVGDDFLTRYWRPEPSAPESAGTDPSPRG